MDLISVPKTVLCFAVSDNLFFSDIGANIDVFRMGWNTLFIV